MAEFIFPNTSPENTSKHNLELSTIESAAFSAGFLGKILVLKTCKNTPFRERFWDMTKLEPHRNKVKLLILNQAEDCQSIYFHLKHLSISDGKYGLQIKRCNTHTLLSQQSFISYRIFLM